MDGVQLKNMAVRLRKSGLSYAEIINDIKVPKSTLSYWLRNIPLDDRGQALLKSRLVDKQKRGRFSTSIALRARKVFKEKIAFDAAEKEFNVLCKESLFMTGIALYWSTGGRKGNHFQFVNSDPDMIPFMIMWAGKYLKVSKRDISFRIFIREAYMTENIINFWVRTLSIDKERLKITIQRNAYAGNGHTSQSKTEINPYYKGSCMMTITGIAVLRKVLAWQNLLIKYYKGRPNG
jgi:DNA-binding transcriptional ArsR family regulator